MKRNKKPYHIIDEKIRPLVDVLNALEGVETVASCEGHCSPGDTPYVYFKAPVAFARTLAKELREAPEQGMVHAGWEITSVFNENYQLAFSLRSARHEMEAWSTIGQLYRLFFRRRIDADIRCIAALVELAGQHHFRDTEEREGQ